MPRNSPTVTPKKLFSPERGCDLNVWEVAKNKHQRFFVYRSTHPDYIPIGYRQVYVSGSSVIVVVDMVTGFHKDAATPYVYTESEAQNQFGLFVTDDWYMPLEKALANYGKNKRVFCDISMDAVPPTSERTQKEHDDSTIVDTRTFKGRAPGQTYTEEANAIAMENLLMGTA
jgi:hypothetical protein